MTALSEALRDGRGRPMFVCSTCARALTGDDVIAQGLRLPEPDESRDDYFEAELIDALDHLDCALVQPVS